MPPTYVPGQTYDITVRHTNTDQTRVRWGFQLTALDASDEKAGHLAPLDELTQVLDNQGPFPNRQYIEHTSQGTFFGQQNGAAWTFRWTAPATDVGPVTFYAAGNQANGDGNTSGDNIYFTFAASTFTPPAPDFNVTITPVHRDHHARQPRRLQRHRHADGRLHRQRHARHRAPARQPDRTPSTP